VLSDADLKKVKSPKAEAAPKPKATRKKKKEETTAAATDEPKEGDICPLCGQGHIIKGKTAYGCSRWKEGCTYRVPFKQ
jgi:DNA topoisomerase-3